MKKIKNYSIYIGFLAGLFGAFAGTILIYLSRFSFMSIAEYYRTIWESGITGPIISLGAILNLLVFFTFYWTRNYLMARGVIVSMFFWVVVILVLKVVN